MQSRKLLISVAGVILFLVAGGLAMFLKPDEKQQQTNNIITAQTTQQIQESQPQTKSNWFIYVTGAVKNPGVYEVSEDSRIFHVIKSAGGFTKNADETSLNLAAPLANGVHIHVDEKVNIINDSVNNPNYSLIDINRASLSELQKIKGVGPSLAQRIVDYRNSHGSFTKPEDLLKVKGIGSATLEKIRPQITINNARVNNQYVQNNNHTNNSSKIDINNASLNELQKINGIGPTLAQRIIDYRNSHGAFQNINDLSKVNGIGQAKMNQIKSQITVNNSQFIQSPLSYSSQLQSKININNASLNELQKINGIGETLAQRIITYRNSHGLFSRIDDIKKVKGIGQAKFSQIKSQITVH